MVSTTPRDHGAEYLFHVLWTWKILWISDLRQRSEPAYEQFCSAEERSSKVRAPLFISAWSLCLTAISLCASYSTRYFTAQNGKELKWKIIDGRMEVRAFLFRHPIRLSGVSCHRVLTLILPRVVLQRAHSHRDLRTRYVCRQKGNRQVDHQTPRASDLHGNRYRPPTESNGVGLWVAGRSFQPIGGWILIPLALVRSPAVWESRAPWTPPKL